MSVVTVQAQKKSMPVNIKTSGIVTALQAVDVRAQVSTLVSKVHIHEGDFVKAGQLLFTLDARSDEANVAKTRAQLAKDQAALADAQRQLARAKQLFGQNFVSQGAVDTAQAQVESLQATVAADQAAVEVAKVPLSYARVLAPLAGRVGSIPVTAGSVVQANTTSLLTITQLSPIAVTFSIPQRNLADALAALNTGAEVSAILADGGGTFKGRLQFVDNAVDAASGTLKVKAVFPNKDQALWPGAFVQVAQTVKTLEDVVVVPQTAVVQGARGTSVYVLESGKAAQKPVQVLYAQDGDVALEGIVAGDVVVLDGKQNLRPGVAAVEKPRDANAKSGKEGKGKKADTADKPQPSDKAAP